jgi:hypothetical protein
MVLLWKMNMMMISTKLCRAIIDATQCIEQHVSVFLVRRGLLLIIHRHFTKNTASNGSDFPTRREKGEKTTLMDAVAGGWTRAMFGKHLRWKIWSLVPLLETGIDCTSTVWVSRRFVANKKPCRSTTE